MPIMRKFVSILSGVMLLAGPALARDCSSQTPPDPGSSMAGPEPCNSLPPHAATARFRTFGGELGTTRVGPARRVTQFKQPNRNRDVVTPRTEPVLRGVE